MDIKEKASQASIILANPVFQEIWERLEKDIISEWQISEHTHEREQHWHRINALSSVKEDLEALIDSAKIEAKGDTRL